MAKLPSGIEVRGDAYRVRIRRRGYPDQTATFPTLGEAKVWKEKIEGEMAGGGFLDGKKLRTTLLKDLILRYVEEVTPKKKGAVAETYILEALAENPIAAHSLDKFADGELASKLRNELESKPTRRGTPRKAATVIRILAAASSVCRHASRNWGYPAFRNPFEMIDKPLLTRASSRRSRLASEDEIKAIVNAASGSIFLPTFATLAAESAARRSELCRLKWADVDLDECLITVRDSKNGDPRVIPIPGQSPLLLARFKKDDPAGGRGYVFKGRPKDPDTKPIDYPSVAPDSASRAFIRARKRVSKTMPSIMDLRLHDLRHTAATNLASLNAHGAAFTIVDLAAITGHRDVNSVARYLHPKAAELRDRINAATAAKVKSQEDKKHAEQGDGEKKKRTRRPSGK